MIEPGGRSGFLHEAAHSSFVKGEVFRQEFEGNVTTKLKILCEINFAHTS